MQQTLSPKTLAGQFSEERYKLFVEGYSSEKGVYFEDTLVDGLSVLNAVHKYGDMEDRKGKIASIQECFSTLSNTGLSKPEEWRNVINYLEELEEVQHDEVKSYNSSRVEYAKLANLFTRNEMQICADPNDELQEAVERNDVRRQLIIRRSKSVDAVLDQLGLIKSLASDILEGLEKQQSSGRSLAGDKENGD